MLALHADMSIRCSILSRDKITTAASYIMVRTSVAAPRYSAAAIDLARLILSRREPEVHPYGSRSDDFVVITIGKLYLSPSAYRWFRKSRRRAWSR
jgi:hypothetical protein